MKDDIEQLKYVERYLLRQCMFKMADSVARARTAIECDAEHSERERREEFLKLNGL